MLFYLAIVLVGIFSGAAAAMVGFGIGSLLIPFFTLRYGIALAVPAAALPHAVATAMCCWTLRRAIDRRTVTRFGLISAFGGLAGSILYVEIQSAVLVKMVGCLLLLTAVSVWTGLTVRLRPHGMFVPLLGFLSGLFGGVAGNQGGLRAAALSTFGMTPQAFVATSASIALIVDAVRVPIYVWQRGTGLIDLWVPIALATAGAAAGTVLGERLLPNISQGTFKKILATAIGILGLYLTFGLLPR